MGYSPERINPGDRIHTLASVTKLVAASDAKWLDVVKFIYDVIVPAGVFVCSSIKVAEAAKITENIQRDVNIALMNQLAELYQRLHIPTGEVWQAAATKWNFLPFRPGLAGGHCISVDPYYLLHKASQVSFSPTLVAEARRINEMVKARIVKRLLAHLEQAGVDKKSARILIMGVTFKANVADVRNAKIAEVALELMKLGCHIDLSDPLADAAALQQEYGLTLVQTEKVDYDIIVIAADHAAYYTLDEDYFCQRTRTGALVADLNGIYRNKINQRNYWTL
jgi:UDP-N-acetyl-D-galactosamine dehydrogenase